VENVKEKIRSKEAPGTTGANTEKKLFEKEQVSSFYKIYNLWIVFFVLSY